MTSVVFGATAKLSSIARVLCYSPQKSLKVWDNPLAGNSKKRAMSIYLNAFPVGTTLT